MAHPALAEAVPTAWLGVLGAALAEPYLGDAGTAPGTTSMWGSPGVGSGKQVPSSSAASPPPSTSSTPTVRQ